MRRGSSTYRISTLRCFDALSYSIKQVKAAFPTGKRAQSKHEMTPITGKYCEQPLPKVSYKSYLQHLVVYVLTHKKLGIVLLKNSARLLPLKKLEGKTIAIIGPNAARSVATGGGSSNLVPHYRTTPYDSLKTRLAEEFPSATVTTAQGIPVDRYLPLIDPAVMRNPGTGESGLVISIWRNMAHEGDPFLVENRKSSNLVLYDSLPTELTMGERYSYRARTIITPKTTGTHQFSLSSCGPGKLFIDGKLIIDIPRRWWSPKSSLFMSYGSPEERVEVHMNAGKSYELLLESISREPKPIEVTYTGEIERDETQDGGRIGFLENEGDLKQRFNQAVEVARSSDIAIVVVGRDADWETETSDIESLNLPRESDALVCAIARANPNTIVVNQSGGPIAMPWEESVSTIIQAWYQGQEQGNALADILLGVVNPCGKLPVTFPRRIEDTPAFDNYPGENDKVWYGEGIYLGYRFYDHRKIEPLFPFGAGLSYTSFEYSNIRLSKNVFLGEEGGSATIDVEVDVTNTGTMEGKEIVQFYVTQVTTPRLGRPVRELKGWDKVLVRPGETAVARATLDRVAISYWDDSINKWVADGNSEFKVAAAKHSRDEGIAASFSSPFRYEWVH
jgi:beta-glucosidase